MIRERDKKKNTNLKPQLEILKIQFVAKATKTLLFKHNLKIQWR